MASAAGWVRWYLYKRDNEGAPAMNFVDSSGRLHAARCGRCRSYVRHSTRVGDPVCGHCGAPWPYVTKHLMKGEVKRSLNPDASEDRLARFADVGRIIHRMLTDHHWGWPMRYFVANAAGFSVREIAREAVRVWPGAPDRSKSQVHEHASRAEVEFARRLAEAEIPVD